MVPYERWRMEGRQTLTASPPFSSCAHWEFKSPTRLAWLLLEKRKLPRRFTSFRQQSRREKNRDYATWWALPSLNRTAFSTSLPSYLHPISSQFLGVAQLLAQSIRVLRHFEINIRIVCINIVCLIWLLSWTMHEKECEHNLAEIMNGICDHHLWPS